MTNLNELQKKIGYEYTFDCVQCGYCLPACPTYETMRKETHSPRGRINLVKMAAEGKLNLEEIRDPIDKCLGCRACQVVCPTGVEYGRILEGAKEVLSDNQQLSFSKRVAKNFIFNDLFPNPSRMNLLGNLMWFYQVSGFQNIVQNIKILKIAPLNLGKFEAIMPKITSPNQRQKRKVVVKAEGKKRIKVALFTGCIMDTMFYETNQNTINLLKKSGAEVVIPEKQTCCGALHSHAGDVSVAKNLARKNIEVFEKEEIDYVINNAGGCGAMLKEYDHLFENDPEWSGRAKRFVNQSKDISEVLYELDGLTLTKSVKDIVTYQPSCHLSNVQKVHDEPLKLLNSIPGIRYKEMKDYNGCCGSAGIYNIVNYQESMEILDSKMEKFKPTQATTIVTTNPGCLLQMKMGIKREKLEGRVRVVHLVDLLMEASE
ncbi:(Fe-S)-binding protein [Halalkalibacter okhensis]|uniref:Glycolate oxidase iron-sulfur subunit n=1 Tax=Halalkalibacter okhensis TaxID=333138 RepID=A0A0B0IHH2_9BACI|nr:(Fe-S)-binding protein [Halalkalibacter okhensis]KHF39504.1 glycolate oxidase [Halalkalibacter okhensis]